MNEVTKKTVRITSIIPTNDMVLNDANTTNKSQVAAKFALHDKRWWRVLADAQSFVMRLEALRHHDRGRIAALRRSAGNVLADARNVAWIEGWLDGVSPYRHEHYFLIATLFDHNRKRPISGDLGETMRLVKANASDSFEQRFLVLLDAQFDQLHDALDGTKSGGGELAYRLAQMIKLAASKEVGINWPVLLADLCCWEWQGKPVQKKWARNFYTPRLGPDDSDDNTVD